MNVSDWCSSYVSLPPPSLTSPPNKQGTFQDVAVRMSVLRNYAGELVNCTFTKTSILFNTPIMASANEIVPSVSHTEMRNAATNAESPILQASDISSLPLISTSAPLCDAIFIHRFTVVTRLLRKALSSLSFSDHRLRYTSN
uniref:Exonuclease domain-containing protein n=1 Tax=Parascaris univalens TaxID=6257 RepID=A0A915BHL3_PARUN